MALPSLLFIGHLCHDRLPSGEIKLGGTAAYASFLAKEMGADVTILTSVGEDFAFLDLFEKEDIILHNVAAKRTTVFENIYSEGAERIQYLHARAGTIKSTDLPPTLPTPDLVLFCPIADEVDFSLLECFPNAMKAATIQGWLRGWDESKKVFPKAMNWKQLTPLDLLIFSDEDMIGFEDYIPVICDYVPFVIMTRGRDGVRVFQKDIGTDFPTEPIEVKDATGAGDSFATAFSLEYFRNRDLKNAVDFGQQVAREVIGMN